MPRQLSDSLYQGEHPIPGVASIGSLCGEKTGTYTSVDECHTESLGYSEIGLQMSSFIIHLSCYIN